MKRSDLEIGNRYAGPEGRCYEIVDLSPGWRIGGNGDWVIDNSRNSRHMPGRGETSYRSNLAVKAYLVTGEEMTKAVIDPRRLTKKWVDYQSIQTGYEVERVQASRLVSLLRRNLRGYPGYSPAQGDVYQVSIDGSHVRIPVGDLAALLDVAYGNGS